MIDKEAMAAKQRAEHCGEWWPGKHRDSFLRVASGMRLKKRIWAMIEINSGGPLLQITGYSGYLVKLDDVRYGDQVFLVMAGRIGVLEHRGLNRSMVLDLVELLPDCKEYLGWNGTPVGELPREAYRWAKEFASVTNTQRAVGWMRAGFDCDRASWRD